MAFFQDNLGKLEPER